MLPRHFASRLSSALIPGNSSSGTRRGIVARVDGLVRDHRHLLTVYRNAKHTASVVIRRSNAEMYRKHAVRPSPLL